MVEKVEGSIFLCHMLKSWHMACHTNLKKLNVGLDVSLMTIVNPIEKKVLK